MILFGEKQSGNLMAIEAILFKTQFILSVQPK